MSFKVLLLVCCFLLLVTANSLATTTPPPKIHFTIKNNTEGRILSLLALQSDDSTFSTFDTLATVGGFVQGTIIGGGPNSQFKAYQKIIIQTDQRTFNTGPLINGGRCSAFSLELKPKGLEVSSIYYYKIMKGLRFFLVVFLFTYLIKGFPLLLITGRHFKYFYKDFLLLNGIFAFCFLISLNMPFGGNFDKSFERSNMFIYGVLLLIAALETYRYIEQVPESPKRIMFAIIVSSLLWAFPGYLVTLLGTYIFSGC